MRQLRKVAAVMAATAAFGVGGETQAYANGAHTLPECHVKEYDNGYARRCKFFTHSGILRKMVLVQHREHKTENIAANRMVTIETDSKLTRRYDHLDKKIMQCMRSVKTHESWAPINPDLPSIPPGPLEKVMAASCMPIPKPTVEVGTPPILEQA